MSVPFGVFMYPVTIIQARYGGVYEGGEWLAFHLDHTEIPEDATGDDSECAGFWVSQEAITVGRGSMPDLAVRDMVRRINIVNEASPTPGTDSALH